MNKKEIRDFKNMLKTLNNNGKHAKRGNWEIFRGGYDLWYEITYKNIVVLQCINGKTKNVSKDKKFNKYAILFNNI